VPLQVGGIVIHAPEGSLELEEVGRVVLFMFLEFPGGVGEYAVVPSVIGLSENGAEAPKD
jgi:hypothetical protein